jgi:hypothetical protein
MRFFSNRLVAIIGGVLLLSGCEYRDSVTTTQLSSSNSTTVAKSFTSLPRSVDGFRDAMIESGQGFQCDNETTICITPTNISGKVYNMRLRISAANDNHIMMEPIGEETESTTETSETYAFNLAEPVEIAGSFQLSDDDEFDENSNMKDISFIFQYIEVDISGSDTGLSDDYTLRMVYADVADLGYTQGDVLIKDGEEYKWCAEGATSLDNCSTTRPSSPITLVGIPNYVTPYEEGPDIPIFMTEVFADTSGSMIGVSRKQMLENDWEFNADFDLKYALKAEDDDDTLDSIYDLMAKIQFNNMIAVLETTKTANGNICLECEIIPGIDNVDGEEGECEEGDDECEEHDGEEDDGQ